MGYALERMKVESLRELSFAVTRQLKRNGVLQWATAGGQLVVALDGIEVFCSERRRCAKCSVRTRDEGKSRSKSIIIGWWWPLWWFWFSPGGGS